MSIVKKSFGKLSDGREADLYILTNASGASVEITNYGGILRAVNVPDKNGKLDSVVLGYNDVNGYVPTVGYIGALIGRVGNRIANGECELNGKKLVLAKNEHGVTHLHGGKSGFNEKLWDVTPVEGICEDHLMLKYVSPDGEEGYPGTLKVMVTYTFTDENELMIRYEAVSDKDTLCNLTNHTYFNLGGHAHGTVKDHVVAIEADVITKVDSHLIPTGDYMPVTDTPLDLRDGLLLEEGLEVMDTCPQMIPAGGYDHNFVLRKGESMGIAASVYHEESGRYMEVITDQPAIQLYTACTTNATGGKDGASYGHYSGFCLETQHCPDDPNHSNFPGTTVLRPGEKYDTTTIYAFRADD